VGSRAFARREVEKCYLAVLEGIVDPTEWPVELVAGEYRTSPRMQQDMEDYLLRFQVRCSASTEESLFIAIFEGEMPAI
jgi:23S rRNA-/tRNA-specific pseudouridylate synthase